MESKSIFQSKTFWGAVLSMLGKIAAVHFGIAATPELVDAGATAISLGASAVGDLVAVYGRVKATTVIK